MNKDTLISQRLSLYLTLVEIGLGGLLHALKLPLAGYFLSLHQIFCLARAQLKLSEKHTLQPLIISTNAAILKTMTPMGKRLTPFLAIIIQGALYNLGTAIVGSNFLGQSIGACLASLWGFIQPSFLAYIFFGNRLLEGLVILQSYCAQTMPWLNLYVLIVLCVCLKGVLGIGMVISAHRLSDKKWIRYQEVMVSVSQKFSQRRSKKTFLKRIIKELFSMWFILPLIISILALTTVEESTIGIFYFIGRVFSAYLMFSILINFINVEKLACILKNAGFIHLSHHLEHTLKSLQFSKGVNQ